jgi:uncharacterized glyoxalase superfamily protein PhnB
MSSVEASITPVLRYRDPRTAARWLCEAFGFREHEAARDADGVPTYVVLRLGDSFVLVRPVANLGFDDLMVQPEDVGGANTQVCYVAIRDADAHRVRAQAAGAKIEIELQDDGLGGQFYSCRDLEGHLWSFGTRAYGSAGEGAGAGDPAGQNRRPPSTALVAVPRPPRGRSAAGPLLRNFATAAVVAALGVGGWTLYTTYGEGGSKSMAAVLTEAANRAEDLLAQLTQERSRRSAAEDAVRGAEARTAQERAAAAEVRQTLERTLAELTREGREKADALKALASEKARAEDLERSRVGSQAALATAQEQVAQLQQDRLALREQLLAANAALLAAQVEIETLRTPQLVPKPDESGPQQTPADAADAAAKTSASQEPDPPELTAKAAELPTAEPKAACASAVQGKIPFGAKASSTWAEENLARLCQGAETSLEPAKCFEELMRGKVTWGEGSVWTASNALALCAGTRSARRTLDCFAARLAAENKWQAAIRRCKTI